MADQMVDLAFLARRIEQLRAADANVARELKSADGDGTSGGMEARVAALEAHMVHVRTDLAEVRHDVGILKTDVAKLSTIVERLPGYPGMASLVVGGMTLFALIITFADEIKHVFGIR